MWRYKKVRRTTLIALACSSFLIGLGLVQAGWQLAGVGWSALASVLLLLVMQKKLCIAVPAVIIAGLLFGVWRGTAMQSDLQKYQQFFGSKVALHGVVVDDPVYDDKGQRDFKVRDVTIDGDRLPGQTRIKSFTLQDARRGDTVQITGKMYDGFGYYQAAMYYADVQVVAKQTNWLDSVRRQFAANVLSAVPDPQASLGLGFLIGLKSSLPNDLNDQLQVLGLTHIVVASGYNLTVLVRVARRLFEKRSKYQTAAAIVGLMAAFVAVTGFSPSMSRAALVTGLVVLAWYFGRRIHPVVVLLVAATITTIINPLYLWYDVGWWLSFLAFAGVLLLAPLLQRRMFGGKDAPLLGQVVIETIAAQLLTLPLIMWLFGDFSVLSLLANVLVVPVIPLAMFLAFIAGTLGAALPVVALPATWVLSYVTEVVRMMASIPWASIPFSVHAAVMVGMYAAMVGAGIVLWRKTNHDYLGRSVIE